MKNAIRLLAGIGFLSSSAFAQQSAQQPVVFSTESYPPFTYQEPDGTYRGVGVDQVDIIMKEVSWPYSLEIMPWARAIARAETQPMHCVFAAARTPEREARFKWVVPLMTDRSILVSRSEAGLTPKTLDEARQYSVGTQREDYTEALLRNLGFPKIDLSADVDTTLRKLLGGRIDLMPMSIGVYETLKATGTRIEAVIPLTEQRLGIACNKAVPDDLISRMQAALDRIVRDGVQSAIYRRYGIHIPQ